MNRHAFRSVCGRARPEIGQASETLHSYFRQFSTTQLQAAEGKPPSRAANTASQISSVARARGQGRPTGAAAADGAGKPKVLDIKNAPRGLGRGRGGFALRGGRGGRGGAAVASTRPTGQFSGNFRGGAPRGRGGMRGRGGSGGSGGRGSRGGARGGGRRQNRDGDDRKSQAGKVDGEMDANAKAFDDTMRFGERSRFEPQVSLSDLASHMPAVPSSAPSRGTTAAAAVMQNLSVLGTSDLVGAANARQARNTAVNLNKGGLLFFADVADRQAAEAHLQAQKQAKATADGDAAAAAAAPEGEDGNKSDKAAAAMTTSEPIISDAEEAIRQIVLEKAVQGKYEVPKFAQDPAGVARSWHLRAETYKLQDVDSFEKKLTSLLPGKNGAKGAGKGAGKKQARA